MQRPGTFLVWLEKIGMLMPDEVRLGSGAVATFRPLRAVSATEKLATIIDFIEFCTACHAEGRRFEPRRSRHFNY